MLGNTNAVINKNISTISQEIVNISLKTNQFSHEDILGAKINVSYGSYSKDYIWDGNIITFSIPSYVTYSISFGNIENYNQDLKQCTHNAIEGNTRQINVLYSTEIVTVNVSWEDGSIHEDGIITINEISSMIPSSGIITQKIAYGETYNIKLENMPGYVGDGYKTFTASIPQRNVDMLYITSRIGVYIQDITGKLWAYDKWDGTVVPNGIYVATDEHSFIMSLHNYYNSMQYADISCDWSSIPIYYSENDYNGIGNTSMFVNATGFIIKGVISDCNNFTFPNGKHEGYLGSIGEYKIIEDNLAYIQQCLLTCGGDEILNEPIGKYWTSNRAEDDFGHHMWLWYPLTTTFSSTANFGMTPYERNYFRIFTTV